MIRKSFFGRILGALAGLMNRGRAIERDAAPAPIPGKRNSDTKIEQKSKPPKKRRLNFLPYALRRHLGDSEMEKQVTRARMNKIRDNLGMSRNSVVNLQRIFLCPTLHPHVAKDGSRWSNRYLVEDRNFSVKKGKETKAA